MNVKLGNIAAKEGSEGANTKEFKSLKGNRVTEVNLPKEFTLSSAFVAITSPTGVWANHSDKNPVWVESDSDGLAALLAEHFGCPVGQPEGWGN